MVWTKYWVTEQDAYPLPAPFWLHFSFWENCLLKDRNNKYYTIQYFKTQWLILITQQMDCCFLIDYWFSRWSWELWCSSCVCSLHAGIPCACECSLPRYALCFFLCDGLSDGFMCFMCSMFIASPGAYESKYYLDWRNVNTLTINQPKGKFASELIELSSSGVGRW